MSALVVKSRFAGLKIEDDDYPPTSDNQKKKAKAASAQAALKKAEAPKKIKNTPKTQTAPKKKKPKQNATTSEQWEMWKQKDEELVDGNFENELQQAILLSKLDYEEKKDVYKQVKKEADTEKKLIDQNSRTGTKKQKKGKSVMSLDQFNEMMNTGEENKGNNDEDSDSIEITKPNVKDTEFFERIKDDTKHELLKDKINDRVRHRQTVSDEVITRVQFIDTLEKKDKEILALQQEVSTLKKELLTVKSRNKKLCNILGQGEMKDKAQVLIEVERLRAVQAELTAELAALHTDLEKERSKNAQDPRTKDKKKKGGNDKEKNVC